MATSGTTTFNQTRSEIIQAALRKLHVLPEGGTASANQLSNANEELNRLVKTLQTQGVRLWTREWITQVPQTASEVTGTDGNIYTCVRSHTSSTDNKPITGSDYASYWVLRGDTGGSWADSTSYTSSSDFTLGSGYIGIERANVRHKEYDYPMELKSFYDYFNEDDKHTTTTIPDSIIIDRAYPTITCYLYPYPETPADILINILAIKKLEDFTGDSDNPDFPVRWLNVLVWGLTAYLAPEYNLESKANYYMSMYKEELNNAKKDDNETGPNFISSPYYNRRFWT